MPLALTSLICAAADLASAQSNQDTQARGKEIIARCVEANRHWLIGPAKQVQNFSYELHRVSGTQEFKITNPSKTPRARLQGITYSGMLQRLARAPQSATVLAISEEPKRARLTLKFDPALRCAVGNGVENSWNGYHSFGGDEGVLVIDTERWVPLETQLGRLHETFGEFVQVDPGHCAPLKIRIEVGEAVYDWRFRVYEPGLWLFDDSFSEGRRIAWVEKVSVNSAAPTVVHATASSKALASAAQIGSQQVTRFLNANRHWLLPSLEPRRGLTYEYRQEEPYLERILIDSAGNILARLESSKESPRNPTRQQLLLADGRSFSGDVTNTLIKLNPAPAPDGQARNASQRDGLAQHLAIGLALECALTRLAREPEQFWADTGPIRGDTNRYLLVLRPKHDARLFTGTMLAFSSWAFMHDVGYNSSEVLCDIATHRPIEEKDYAGKNELKGHYFFENWLKNSSGAAPGVIRAVIPHQKDGKDESLEMRARFHFPMPGAWFLEEVKSQFRGSKEGSTGTVRIISSTAAVHSEIGELIRKAEATETLLAGLENALDRGAKASLAGSSWAPIFVNAMWTDQAREPSRADESRRDGQLRPQSLIGVYRARIVENPANSIAVELEGLSTASWKEFQTRWHVSLHDDGGRLLAAGTTNLIVRAENGPAPFLVRVAMPLTDTSASSMTWQLQAEGTVERMTGAYHGHGVWMHFVGR